MVLNTPSALIKHGLRMPRRFARGNYGRVALTVLALAAGVAAVCSNRLNSRLVLQAFEDVVDLTVGQASLQVTRGEGGTFGKDVAITVAKVPGVARVVPVVSAQAFTTDGTNELLVVHGFDIVDAAAARVYGVDAAVRRTARSVRLLFPGAVLLTEQFARRHGLAVGKRIDLDTPSGRQTFTVHGLLEAEGVARAYGGNLVVMGLYAAQMAFTGRGSINRVDVVVKPDRDPVQVATAIKAVLAADMRVESLASQKEVLATSIRSVRLLTQVSAAAALLAAFLIAFSSLSTLFEARVWQLGVLRAVGLRRRSIWWELIKESLLLGAAGVVIGIPAGIGLARAALPLITTAAALNANVGTPTAHFAIRGSPLALAAVLGMGSAFLAAALPAWRAARQEVVETVRGRGVEQPGLSAGPPWLLRAVVAGATAVAIVMEITFKSALWGLVAGALVGVTATLAARPLVDLLSSTVLAGFAGLTGPAARLAAAHIRRNPRRAALTVATIGVGIGSVLWLWMLSRSFERSVVDVLSQAIRADLVVSSSHIGAAFVEAPVTGELVEKLRAIPGVLAVAATRDVEWQHAGGPIALEASDQLHFTDREFGQWPLDSGHLPDVWGAVVKGEAAIASTNFIQNLHARVGDTVTLTTPSGPLPLRIAGVTTHFLSPRGTLMLSREVYARYWQDTQVSRVHVRIQEGASVAAVGAAIAASLGRTYSLRILSSGELVDYFASQVRKAFASVNIDAAATLLVVLIGVAETLAAGVATQKQEIGAIRVVGARRQHLRHMVLVEGLVLVTLGLVLAGLMGFAQGALWVEVTFPYLFGFVFPLHVPYARAALLALLTIGAGMLAALVPGQRAARLQPAVAVRYE